MIINDPDTCSEFLVYSSKFDPFSSEDVRPLEAKLDSIISMTIGLDFSDSMIELANFVGAVKKEVAGIIKWIEKVNVLDEGVKTDLLARGEEILKAIGTNAYMLRQSKISRMGSRVSECQGSVKLMLGSAIYYNHLMIKFIDRVDDEIQDGYFDADPEVQEKFKEIRSKERDVISTNISRKGFWKARKKDSKEIEDIGGLAESMGLG